MHGFAGTGLLDGGATAVDREDQAGGVDVLGEQRPFVLARAAAVELVGGVDAEHDAAVGVVVRGGEHRLAQRRAAGGPVGLVGGGRHPVGDGDGDQGLGRRCDRQQPEGERGGGEQGDDGAWHVVTLGDSAVTPLQANRRSPSAWGSSTCCSQVGHHQRASTGVPQVPWCSGVGPRRRRPRRVLGAPLGEQAQGVGQRLPGGREAVGEADGPAGVRLGHDEALGLEGRRRLARTFGATPGSSSSQLAEAARPVEQGGDEQQRPPVADAAGGGVEGGQVGVRRGCRRRRHRAACGVAFARDGTCAS